MKAIISPYVYVGLEGNMLNEPRQDKIVDCIGRLYERKGILTPAYNRLNLKKDKRNYKTLIKSKRRIREMVELKQMMAYHLRQRTTMTWKAIGQVFGGYDHATMIHGVAVMRDLIEYSPIHKELSDEITARLNIIL